jgi:hypothetical protein
MSEKIVSISENDQQRSATINAIDALDREIDAVWGLIAIIEVLDRESRNNQYAGGALRVAHNHLDALIAIRRWPWRGLGARPEGAPGDVGRNPPCLILGEQLGR